MEEFLCDLAPGAHELLDWSSFTLLSFKSIKIPGQINADA